MGSMLSPNRVIAKDVKVVPTAAMPDARVARVGGLPWHESTGEVIMFLNLELEVTLVSI